MRANHSSDPHPQHIQNSQNDLVQLINELSDISENLTSYFEFCQNREKNLMGFLREINLN
jgi:hypothetical protein